MVLMLASKNTKSSHEPCLYFYTHKSETNKCKTHLLTIYTYFSLMYKILLNIYFQTGHPSYGHVLTNSELRYAFG